MSYAALATDYDGTIAWEGQVDAPTREALRRARLAGLRLVVVTGRRLADLLDAFPHLALFDRVVAENGAVLYDPSSRSVRVLAGPPPPKLIKVLTDARIPLSVGRVIVATVEPYQDAVLDAIRDLGIEWHVIFNKDSVMALPSGITKGTGLAQVLSDLGVPLERTIGVGDAENDQPFLRMCGLAVAVANALPAVKEAAAVVTAGAQGAGVVELIDRLLTGRPGDIRVSSPRR